MACNNIINKKGFTIVELMIAVTVFSVAAVLVMTGVIVIARQYQQASTRVALEEASRNIHQQITESIRFAKGTISSPLPSTASSSTNYSYVCIGSNMYIYGTYNSPYDTNYTSLKEGLYLRQAVECDSANADIDLATNLLPPKSKVLIFTIGNAAANNGKISTLFIRSGDDNLVDFSGALPSEIKCKSGVAGREYCTYVPLESYATQRVGS